MFLIFHDFQFSLHTPGLQCAFLIFHVFQCFSPYSRSNSVSVSFSMFSWFLAILEVLQCVFLIFHVFQCYLPYFTSYSVSLSFSMIFSFLAILLVLQCAFLFFQIFECFSRYSRSYSVHFSFSTFLGVSNHIPGQDLPCVFLIFHDFQFSCHTPGPTVCI